MLINISGVSYSIDFFQGVYSLRDSNDRLMDYSTDLIKLLRQVWKLEDTRN